jgi:hypothetical protein
MCGVFWRYHFVDMILASSGQNWLDTFRASHICMWPKMVEGYLQCRFLNAVFCAEVSLCDM